eukprot:GHVU01111537.1.p1 GENE.GHVU01111537.1~~GHVU01111537.1.p1  ORF type:complete len:304 (+),score=32.02 GHVU01111537.1:146-1057(+)
MGVPPFSRKLACAVLIGIHVLLCRGHHVDGITTQYVDSSENSESSERVTKVNLNSGAKRMAHGSDGKKRPLSDSYTILYSKELPPSDSPNIFPDDSRDLSRQETSAPPPTPSSEVLGEKPSTAYAQEETNSRMQNKLKPLSLYFYGKEYGRKIGKEMKYTIAGGEAAASIEVSFCGGQERAGFTYADLGQYEPMVQRQFELTYKSLSQQAMFAYTLMYALLFDSNEKIQAIGESVKARTSSIFIKASETEDEPQWRHLSLKTTWITTVGSLGDKVQIVIAKNEVSRFTQWEASRDMCYSPCVG